VVGALAAEDHVVFLFATRVGVPNEVHLSALERPIGEALRELGQDGARVRLNVRRIEIEVSLGVRDSAGALDFVRDVDLALRGIVVGLGVRGRRRGSRRSLSIAGWGGRGGLRVGSARNDEARRKE